MALVRLVADDRNPPLAFQLQDANTDEYIDISNANKTVYAALRADGGSADLTTITLDKVDGGETVGQCILNWPAASLDDLEGDYTLEVYIEDSVTGRETCWNVVKLYVRARQSD